MIVGTQCSFMSVETKGGHISSDPKEKPIQHKLLKKKELMLTMIERYQKTQCITKFKVVDLASRFPRFQSI